MHTGDGIIHTTRGAIGTLHGRLTIRGTPDGPATTVVCGTDHGIITMVTCQEGITGPTVITTATGTHQIIQATSITREGPDETVSMEGESLPDLTPLQQPTTLRLHLIQEDLT